MLFPPATATSEQGGTLRTTTNFKFGKECRSLRALFELLEAGVPAKQVVFLEEGLNSLFIDGYEFDGEEEWHWWRGQWWQWRDGDWQPWVRGFMGTRVLSLGPRAMQCQDCL